MLFECESNAHVGLAVSFGDSTQLLRHSEIEYFEICVAVFALPNTFMLLHDWTLEST
jgi:hypothetical protein